MSELLFVYGTLQPERAPHGVRALLAAFRWREPGRVAGRLYDLGAYPAAVLDPAEAGRIHGRLAELPEDPGLWEALDRYEGVDRTRPLFRRVRCRVERAQGGPVEAWIYEYAREPRGAVRIADGRDPQVRPAR